MPEKFGIGAELSTGFRKSIAFGPYPDRPIGEREYEIRENKGCSPTLFIPRELTSREEIEHASCDDGGGAQER